MLISFYKKNSRPVFAINLLFMWSVATFCYGIADEGIYISRYTNPDMWIGTTEFGFKTLINLCHFFNVDYVGFKGVVFAICLLCIGSTVFRFSKYPNIILMLYFLCPFPLNVAQIRNFIANSIMIYYFRYIMQETKSKHVLWKFDSNDLKFILGIIIAATMHTAALLWLVLLFARKFDTKKNYWIMVIMNLLFMFVITPSSLSKIVSLFGAGNRINAYFTLEYAQSEWKNYGPVISVVFASLFAIFMVKYKTRKTSNNNELIICEKINVSSLGLVGMMIRYTSEIRRVQEGICIINYILVTNSISEKDFKINKVSKKNLSVLSGILLFVLIYTILILIMYLKESIWIPFWCNNSLWYW